MRTLITLALLLSSAVAHAEFTYNRRSDLEAVPVCWEEATAFRNPQKFLSGEWRAIHSKYNRGIEAFCRAEGFDRAELTRSANSGSAVFAYLNSAFRWELNRGGEFATMVTCYRRTCR